jgi:hypothetical protein
LRPVRSASERANAAASLVTFSSWIAPLTPTGWAAPMLVPGAIALTGQASITNIPADAALAPDGPVQHSTGVRAARIALTIVRMAESSPPGVSIRSSTASSPRSSAAAMPSSR